MLTFLQKKELTEEAKKKLTGDGNVMYGKQELWTTQFHRPEAKELNSELLSETNPGADVGEDAGVHPPPPITCSFVI